jgi:hypothetical protein
LVVRKPLRSLPFPAEENGTKGFPSASIPASNEIYDEEYAPSAPSVLGAALDLSLPVLFNFHMFVVLMKDHYKKESQSSDERASEPTDEVEIAEGKVDVKDDVWMTPPQVPPKVLPLIFITPLILRSMIPRRQRRRFFSIILQGTALSPFKPVRFRDSFVADCVTSLVRPLGDLIFAFSYYFIAIFGFFGKYNLNEAGSVVSKAALLHGIVLPVLSILPIFVAFLQTLRQAYDSGKRWPYLGNSFKYLTAGLVILYGMTHTAGARSTWWTWAFVLATIYQFIWDVCFDWELLVFVPRESIGKRTSLIPLPFRRLGGQIKLRPRRLFDDDSLYWKALLVNAGLRFCWMTGFIPAYRVSILDGSTQVTFVNVVNGWSFVLMAVAEILRRTIWGIIRVELETIKLASEVENGSATTTATSVDEYMKGGRRNAPRTTSLEPLFSPTWRCRLSKTSKPVQEEDTIHNESHLEQTEHALSLNSSKNTSGKNNFHWLCLELLLWTFTFCLLSYYVISAE